MRILIAIFTILDTYFHPPARPQPVAKAPTLLANPERAAFNRAADRLASKVTTPTVEELSEYFETDDDLHIPDFGEQFERERQRNTKAYREVESETRRILGLADNSKVVVSG
jgi:hypothetical protein